MIKEEKSLLVKKLNKKKLGKIGKLFVLQIITIAIVPIFLLSDTYDFTIAFFIIFKSLIFYIVLSALSFKKYYLIGFYFSFYFFIHNYLLIITDFNISEKNLSEISGNLIDVNYCDYSFKNSIAINNKFNNKTRCQEKEGYIYIKDNLNQIIRFKCGIFLDSNCDEELKNFQLSKDKEIFIKLRYSSIDDKLFAYGLLNNNIFLPYEHFSQKYSYQRTKLIVFIFYLSLNSIIFFMFAKNKELKYDI